MNLKHYLYRLSLYWQETLVRLVHIRTTLPHETNLAQICQLYSEAYSEDITENLIEQLLKIYKNYIAKKLTNYRSKDVYDIVCDIFQNEKVLYGFDDYDKFFASMKLIHKNEEKYLIYFSKIWKRIFDGKDDDIILVEGGALHREGYILQRFRYLGFR